jgi:hypothetical protein
MELRGGSYWQEGWGKGSGKREGIYGWEKGGELRVEKTWE